MGPKIQKRWNMAEHYMKETKANAVECVMV